MAVVIILCCPQKAWHPSNSVEPRWREDDMKDNKNAFMTRCMFAGTVDNDQWCWSVCKSEVSLLFSSLLSIPSPYGCAVPSVSLPVGNPFPSAVLPLNPATGSWELKETNRMPSDHTDEDSPKWPWVPYSHIDWSLKQSVWPTLEIAGS